ncbi:MAG: hypothetical protein COC15_02800 [Legionellales bacterium]|nr:MAG: hypothetical protein COC15_02800 [Legionellales bacterium]
MLANKTYRKIIVTGADSAIFLQGQLSCDINTLDPDQSIWGAYCNIKGRVLALMQVTRPHDDRFELQLPTDLLEHIIKELRKYGMFSKISITEMPAAEYNGSIDIMDLINNKIPMIFANTSGIFLPHYINLPQLGAVNFNKGCYKGQEIIARMEYRGNIKKHLRQYTIPRDTGTALPQPADKLYDAKNQDKPIGTVVLAAENNDTYVVLAEMQDK